ncbi:MAG: cell division DNA translocase FtsK [Sodalis sp. Fle]|nr:MAG: cell division DNA translocase FtsK [Sodalis sp. Fle]
MENLILSQEYYIESKNTSLKKLYCHQLLGAMLVIVGIFAFYLMIALISFNPSDPSWSKTAWHSPIYNRAGEAGAWCADTLFFIFGLPAYAIPPIILFFFWNIFFQYKQRDYIDFFALSLSLIGSLTLLLTSCGLVALNIDNLFYYFPSGGVIGNLLKNAVLSWFNGISATLALLCIWASGFTLFTSWSWLSIAEKIGSIVLCSLDFISNHRRLDDEYDHHSNIDKNGDPLSPDDGNNALYNPL